MNPSPNSAAKSYATRIIGVAFFLLLWEMNSHFELFKIVAPNLPRKFFPSILSIAPKLVAAVASGEYWLALFRTVARCVAAFLLAALLGVSTGLLSARIRHLQDLLFLPTEFLRNLPAVAIIPFAIIAFGIGGSMKTAVAFFWVLLPCLFGNHRRAKFSKWHIDKDSESLQLEREAVAFWCHATCCNATDFCSAPCGFGNFTNSRGDFGNDSWWRWTRRSIGRE